MNLGRYKNECLMRIMRSRCGPGRGSSGEWNEVIGGQMKVTGSVMTGELMTRQVNNTGQKA